MVVVLRENGNGGLSTGNMSGSESVLGAREPTQQCPVGSRKEKAEAPGFRVVKNAVERSFLRLLSCTFWVEMGPPAAVSASTGTSHGVIDLTIS